MTTDTLIDSIIDTCWGRIRGKESIYVTQVMGLIREIENELQISSLFVASEIHLLDQLIRSNPQMKLYKQEVKELLIRLVKYANFEEFLRERFGLSPVEIRLRTAKTPSRFESRKPDPSLRSFITGSRHTKEYTKPVSPPYSPPLKSFSQRSDSDRIYTSINSKDDRIEALKSEITSLQRYVTSLENQIRNQPDSSSRRTLDRERTIKNLDKLCYDYQRELKASKKRDETNKQYISQMVDSINQQEKLIEMLKVKLDLKLVSTSFKADGEEQNKFRDFMVNLPFFKQYYAYFKYKEESKSIGLLFLNGLTLVLSAFIVINILQVVLYLILWVFGSSDSIYVYDDYGSWFSTKSTFVWWKEFEIVEYWVYRIGEWFEV
ncbi:uncharacterized protein CANTADRAFT_24365 [Suhomyces tanzawaensis NRRL Y-17324]|uniref:Uncharacterized protein n=1 Tax=Suhomyces tanzawaensis NRRL Y-17324 TaxID=984487 RepID=A0A1E4SPH9_9ASCO|nr:uncharacterized protein CANTADRAFT_24365 [Suhomyces tanzawaensis NRRL Y-17324]ODV81413.1 hypothetical protein CANTADRAFT_24365 [Suhomyces tanzawaensis NRRL Y-17324]